MSKLKFRQLMSVPLTQIVVFVVFLTLLQLLAVAGIVPNSFTYAIGSTLIYAIVAIGLAESSLGTQGVAKNAGANMFGYAAFDHSPQSAQQFSDDIAIVKLTQETIIQNQNTSFSIQDKKAQQLSVGMSYSTHLAKLPYTMNLFFFFSVYPCDVDTSSP